MVSGPVCTGLPGYTTLSGADCVSRVSHAGHGVPLLPWKHHRTTQVCDTYMYMYVPIVINYFVNL